MTLRLRSVGTAILVAALVSAGPPALAAEPASPADVRRTLDEARQLVDGGKPGKARHLLVAACADLAALAGLERVPSGVRPLVDLCTRLKDDLDLEGVDVSGIEIPHLKTARPDAAKPPATAAKPPVRPAPGISFTRQVAPLLVTHCGGCHVTGRKGGFQMASYDALMKTGVVQRGVGDSSRLVEVIETGDMPRGGGKVAPQDLALLVAWINTGASFDGPDPLAPLGQTPGAAPAATAGMTAPVASAPVVLKPGDVSFAFDVAPVLLKNCAGCHDDDDPEARLSMHTFARFARGGESGAAFVAGRGADSLLVRKIKGASGIEGQRMPIGRPPLPADVIALVEKWIDQGGRLDMLGPNATLADLAAAGRARSLSHDDLKRARFAAAEKLWRRALADEAPATVALDDVIVIGNLPQSRLDEAAGTIESAASVARKQLIDGDGPLLKGGVACLLFAKAYDYSNFRQTILGEERPKGLTGNAGVSGDVAYGALIVPSRSDDDSANDLAALAAEQVAAAAFVGRGAPAWFAQGAGRAVAAKVAPKAAVTKAWKGEAAEALARLAAPEDFFGGHAGPVAQAAIGGGFVSALAPSPAKLQALVARLDGGDSFDTAFVEVFKSPAPALFSAWIAKESRKPTRR
ncbi:MAG: c-type cytochrome domain-containing protein [Planctomycetia bacterium]